jgi:uncharacterized membrane protein
MLRPAEPKDSILRVVKRSRSAVIRDLPVSGELPAIPPQAVALPARDSGYVQVVHLEQLLAAAAARQVIVRLRPRVGETSPRVRRWPGSGPSRPRLWVRP